jgi:hypothetical protein
MKQIIPSGYSKVIVGCLVLVSASLMGCATNSQLRAQLDKAEQIAHQQDEQIAELEARQQKIMADQLALSSRKVGEDVAKDATDMASAVWQWSVTNVTNAVHATEDAAHRCYLQGKDRGGVHSVEEAKKLAEDCWNSSGN